VDPGRKEIGEMWILDEGERWVPDGRGEWVPDGRREVDSERKESDEVLSDGRKACRQQRDDS